jgi:hypothetical protein
MCLQRYFFVNYLSLSLCAGVCKRERETETKRGGELGEILREMEEIQHFSHKEHPLIFVEDFQNDGEIEVVCFGCDKSICGPAYKCSHCNFFLHKSCAELPPEIQCHPLHPNHILFIRAPARNTCDACDKSCQRCFFYRCTRCDFDIDIECASVWLTNTEVIQHFSHEKHPLMFVEEFENDEENEVVCSGCDKSVCGPAYKCPLCNFFLHKSCAELPLEIQHPVHPNHTLILVAPSEDKLCDACLKCCDRCFAYRCHSCNFNLDIECASGWQTKPDDCHQHDFFPIFYQIHFTCQVCGEDRNSFAQVCRICQLFTHMECYRMPRSIRIMADRRHLLTLIYSLGKVIKEHHDHVFCQLCYKKLNLKYAGYYCQPCNFVAHLKCARANSIGVSSDAIDSSVEEEGIDFEEHEECEVLKHFDHEHNLILSRNQVEVHHNNICEGCIRPIITPPFYSCEQCNYFLHSICARLPLKTRLPSHPHLLTLSAIRGDDWINDFSYCMACHRFSNGFAYMCQECYDYFDIRCYLIPKVIEIEGHQHSLFHAISSEEDCNACGLDACLHGLFVCTECDFALGFECVTLPLKAKYEHDLHLLSLTYTAENDSEKHYCLICEEKRDPDKLFYYCVECNFAAHTECVIGRHPYIKYGRNFTQEDHPHPLNFVWKTKNSRPCDYCNETFDGNIAINCTQCKFIVHLHCFDSRG